jgi:hypothetical protein
MPRERLCLLAWTAILAGCTSPASGALTGDDAGLAADGDATMMTDAALEGDGAAADHVAEAAIDAAVDRGDVETGAADVVNDGSVPDAPDASVALPLSVLTNHNDAARTGAYLGETVLTASNVRPATFGMLFARAVDDQLYAQPLYMSRVPIPNKGAHNVLYVATMSDTVYAFDADDPSQANPLWMTSFVNMPQGIVPVTHRDVGLACGVYLDINGNIGVESTPVIDDSAGRMFVVAKTKNQSGVQTYYLHALDVRTGLDQVPPVVIQASVAGTGAGSVGGVIAFDASVQNQRAALLLANGNVYIAFGAYCQSGNYHGWVLAYDAATLTQTAAMSSTPNGGGGGIWMSGGGPSADANGNVYVGTGNGDMDVTTGGANLSETLLKLTPALQVADWFVPFEYPALNSAGDDIGSTSLMQLPETSFVVTGSEGSKLYVNDTGNLGQYNMANDSQIVQSVPLNASQVHSTPVAWPLPAGTMVYVWAAGDTLRSYQWSGGHLALAHTGPRVLGMGQPGGALSLSANGTTPGTAVLWAAQPASGDASQLTVPGILQAFDASNATVELWDSHQAAGDDCGAFAKFTPPTVANGKVYLPSFANQVCVYGEK